MIRCSVTGCDAPPSHELLTVRCEPFPRPVYACLPGARSHGLRYTRRLSATSLVAPSDVGIPVPDFGATEAAAIAKASREAAAPSQRTGRVARGASPEPVAS